MLHNSHEHIEIPIVSHHPSFGSSSIDEIKTDMQTIKSSLNVSSEKFEAAKKRVSIRMNNMPEHTSEQAPDRSSLVANRMASVVDIRRASIELAPIIFPKSTSDSVIKSITSPTIRSKYRQESITEIIKQPRSIMILGKNLSGKKARLVTVDPLDDPQFQFVPTITHESFVIDKSCSSSIHSQHKTSVLSRNPSLRLSSNSLSRHSSRLSSVRFQSIEIDAISDTSEFSLNDNIDFRIDMNTFPIQPNLKEHFILDELTGMRHLIDGSNSNVFKAVYDKTIPIIVKYMMRDPPNRDVAKNEFALEHQILMRISHPNIVAYFGGGIGDDKRPFLCLERLNGGSLKAILSDPNRNTSRSPFSTKRVLEIAFQFADALNYLHTGYHPDVTLIHRDLKPDNIGFTDKGMLKLMDFGLCACVRRRQDMDQTYAMTGNTGSIRYMAPEVLQSLPYNEMVDIYSFGIILWEMATGQTPYQGITIKEFFIRVVINNERPAINSTHSRCISEILATIIQKCWDKNPIKRPKASFIVTHILELLELEQAKKSTSCCTLS